MSMLPLLNLEPLPDYLQTEEPVTINSIRKARKATARGKSAAVANHESNTVELQSYLNFAAFDISCRIGDVERYLKSKERAETTPPDIREQLAEALRELKLCSDIGNFAIGQQFKPN